MGTERKTGPGPASKLSKRAILQAAARYYVQDEKLSDIAADIGLSPSYLGRVLRTAKERGWVTVRLATDHEAELEAQLLRAFPGLVHATVVPHQRTVEETARILGTEMAIWFEELLDADEASGDPRIWNVAVGGGQATAAMIDQLVPRPNRISVGPTILTPECGRVTRNTAGAAAMALALKLRAAGPSDRVGFGPERKGYRYAGTVDPPLEDLDALAKWYASLQARPWYTELLSFWSGVDVAFLGVSKPGWEYKGVMARQPYLERVREAGAVAILTGRYLDAQGRDVPIAPGVPGQDPMIPSDHLRAAVQRHRATDGRTGFVVVEAWGDRADAALPVLLDGGLGNILFVDDEGARRLVEARNRHLHRRDSKMPLRTS